MNCQTTTGYPGSTASSEEIVALADEYRRAAISLLKAGRKSEPLSRAPGQMCAIHAIELYLNAFCRAGGTPPGKIRSNFHNLATHSELAVENGLVLRQRTAAHLHKLTEDREYLVTRYGPEMTSTLPEITRLMATLEEIARKTKKRLGLPADQADEAPAPPELRFVNSAPTDHPPA